MRRILLTASVLASAGTFLVEAQQSQSDRNLTEIEARVESVGTGFCISDDGFFVTNSHVISNAGEVQLLIGDDTIPAKVVKTDPANDLALLKAQGKFASLPIASSRGVKLGDTVATIGFPDVQLQGRSPKLTRGEISSLSGIRYDARYFQISAAVQPGNSGGALVDEHGNVVGVVSAKLSQKAALIVTGALPENVNYAVKSSYLLGFLESVPELASRLKEPITTEVKFADVVEQAKEASALVIAYRTITRSEGALAPPRPSRRTNASADVHMGTWKLNEVKSKLPAKMGKNTTVVYAEKGDKIQVTVDGVDKDGKPTHSVWVGKFDGKAYKSKGNLPWDAAAYRVVNDRTNDITTMKNGKVMWTGRITVAADGKSRTVTVNGTDAAGKRFSSKAIYDRE